MVRRATLDRGVPSDAADEPLPPDPVSARARRQSGQPRRGSGGRWVIWTLRGVIWLVLLLIGYRGIVAIISGPSPAPAATTQSRGAGTFPQPLAQAYALQFGSAYLNFSPATANKRATLLASYLAPGTDPQLGWDGAGTERLQSEQVGSVKVLSDHSAIVTLLAVVNNRTIELGVPIYAAGGKLAVSGEPALLPAPGRATPSAANPGNSDQATAAVLLGQLPPFFRAYASGDQVTLTRFLAPGSAVTGLGGAVTFGSLQSVSVPTGGNTRDIIAVVSWNVGSAASGHSPATTTAPASLQMTYRMTVVRRGGNWYVQSIGASPQSPGPP